MPLPSLCVCTCAVLRPVGAPHEARCPLAEKKIRGVFSDLLPSEGGSDV